MLIMEKIFLSSYWDQVPVYQDTQNYSDIFHIIFSPGIMIKISHNQDIKGKRQFMLNKHIKCSYVPGHFLTKLLKYVYVVYIEGLMGKSLYVSVKYSLIYWTA